jgi:hypothetical protein
MGRALSQVFSAILNIGREGGKHHTLLSVTDCSSQMCDGIRACGRALHEETRPVRRARLVSIGMALVLLAWGKSPALSTGQAGHPFEWDALPRNTWVRLHTTGAVQCKVFHGASALAPDRHTVFFFGADTHDEDYDNSVVRLDLRSLEWSKDYEADTLEDYRITPEGYAVTRSQRPWAMHTFDCWDYHPLTRQLIVVSSPDHAYKVLAHFQERGVWQGKTTPATWFYNPERKTWELVKTNSPRLFAFALVWDPVGQQFIGHDGAKTYHFDSLHRR